MEWLQDFENLLNDLISMVQYGKFFAVGVCVAFLIVFAGLIIINVNINEVKKQNEHIMKMIEARTLRGGNF